MLLKKWLINGKMRMTKDEFRKLFEVIICIIGVGVILWIVLAVTLTLYIYG